MDVTKITGFALGLTGAFLMWHTGVTLAGYFQANGTVQLMALLFDPEHSLRLISAMAAFLAGLAALTERKGGAWLAGIAAALLGVQTMAMLGGHGAVYAWQSEAIFLVILASLFLCMVVSEGAKPKTAIA